MQAMVRAIPGGIIQVYTMVTMQIESSAISLVFFPPLERYCIVYVFEGSLMLILVWNGNI